ncbi:cell wall protein DAN4-like [Scleropages formosus]|uniref:cell wall protein DAN4-like n=1 Tax=Scleropages formosus TaxID=113540 RepID=UPI0010FA7EC7|nr:cell wall protein DAN4-like [Scleropages formosus]XP_029107912.1 cell wall protein DAN4-like [Scleropages formosus]
MTATGITSETSTSTTATTLMSGVTTTETATTTSSEPSTSITATTVKSGITTTETATTTTSGQSATTANAVTSEPSTTLTATTTTSGEYTVTGTTTTSGQSATTATTVILEPSPSTTLTASTTEQSPKTTITSSTSQPSPSTTTASVPTEAVTTVTTTTTTTNPINYSERLELKFSLMIDFTDDLYDPTSENYKKLELQVVLQLTYLYKTKYGPIFIMVIVISFSPGSVVTDTELVFNTSMPDSLPTANDVKQVLIQAISENNSNFTLKINSSSITVQEMAGISTVATIPVSTLATAQSVTVQTTPTSQLETTSTFATNASTSVAATTLTSITATSTATPTTTIAVVIIKLRFAMSKDFTSELSNTSSPQFQTLAAQVYLVVNQVYRDHFGNQYKGSNVTQFSKGSVVTFIDLFFSGTDPLPNSIDIVNALKQAVSNNNTLSIILDSIQINSAAGRNSVSCAVLLAALTLLLAGHL